MKPLPKSENSLVLRTDFSDDAAWEAACAEIQRPNEDGFQACVDCISEPEHAGLGVEQLVMLASGEGAPAFAFVVDSIALQGEDRPILVVDFHSEPGRTFRVVARECWSVENNLAIANMDFSDFADAVDDDGVFRGFRDL